MVCAVQPAGKVREGKFPYRHWSVLTGPEDLGDINFVLRFPERCLHSSHAELVPLLQSVLMHLRVISNSVKAGEPTIHARSLPVTRPQPFGYQGLIQLRKDELPRCVQENSMDRSGTFQSGIRTSVNSSGILGTL
jgi:hypothetical protein